MTDRVRINESAADEWFAVMRHVRPWLSRAEFDELWAKMTSVAKNHRAAELARTQSAIK